jgi:4-alpha-glucanotransferase
MPPPQRARRAGVLIPLFSISSTHSWGIGEIGDIVPITRWLAASAHTILQLLPINELPVAETSPYSALSAMAIDPQFISLRDVEDFVALGGEPALEPSLAERLGRVRRAGRVDYAQVRSLKYQVFRQCFTRFFASEWRGRSARARRLAEFIDQQRWWLDDYALFRALHARYDEAPWTEWPVALAAREPKALEKARAELETEILYREYLQWIADEQWCAARVAAAEVALFGDLPFMVSTDSADVWARQRDFRLDASVGVPPDAFSDTGQDWGLPAYRWDVVGSENFEWLRQRGRRNAALYDGFRIDHLVGFYRTYSRPRAGGEGAFSPTTEAEQLALGERVIVALRDAGAEIFAEDLGLVPDFVRASLARLEVAGYRVFRWEREWNQPGQPFKDPRTYPPISVAASGTHDTQPLVIWWEDAERREREAVLAVPPIRARLTDGDVVAALEDPAITPAVLDAVVSALYQSTSNILLAPLQDLFGWRDRINEPATVGTDNWTWRLPWPVDHLLREPAAIDRGLQLREWARQFGRGR